MAFSDSELHCFFDSMRSRDRGVVYNKAMGLTGAMTLAVIVFPLLLAMPWGFRIGRFLELPFAGCVICAAVFVVLSLLMIGLFLPRYLKWKIRTYLRKNLRNGGFQACPVCKSIETAEDDHYCPCGCLIRPISGVQSSRTELT